MAGNRFELLEWEGVVERFGEDTAREWLWDEYNYSLVLVDNKKNEVIQQDGGEPEDNSFCRDWGWVCPLLNEVYEEGKAAGYDEAQEEWKG